jgi:hypothetical protein
MLDDWVIQTAAENDAEYTRIFGELGMMPTDRERFKLELTELHRKAIAAGEPMRELLKARLDYDKGIHGVLGDENYQRYRDYEESKPARREYTLLQEFASKSNNLAIDPAWSEKIIRLFKDSKAITTETWQGPYDPRPHPEVGVVMVATALSREAADYRKASSNLLQTLPKTDLPLEYQRLLRDYCSQKTTDMEREIARFSVPEEEFKRRMLEEAEKRHQELMMRLPSKSTNQVF